MKRTRIVAAMVATAAIAAALTGCSGSGDSAGGDGKTLRLWHYENADGAMGKAWNEAIKIFEKETGAKVEFEEKSFEQIRSTASQVLNSDQAPDVLEYNKGNATAGLLASQGLLAPLDDAVKKYGWDKKLASSLQTTAKYDDRGIMGSGSWYGVPNYGEYVEVYYNKTAFQDAGVKVPTTLAEFEAAMKTFADKGQTPLSESAAEYPLGQLWYQLALSKADRSFIDDYQLYKGKVDWNGEPLTYATQTIADWTSKGYISKDASGIKAEDAGVSFINGQSPMFYSGSWWYGRFMTEIKGFEWGTFLFPGTDLTPGSAGNMWVVPEHAKNKELAEKFIDITMRPEIQAILGNNGGVPVAADVSAITDAKSKELIENFNSVTSRDGIAFYPDWPTPTFYDQLNAGLQELINGTKSPAEVRKQLGDQYAAGVKDIVG
ncbi:ABC transporter substrate-binding protein [Microbacterium azadirachtae]|uniref:Putative sugar-binding periplasmic protein n=1 Tax=Microbacterium azadirachtae TaxID=582680 RepID=A0A0F0LKQ3_9MICO|nr:extracellular solute-binding protein [Microbacterium azadirachtae]KJL33792.1 putative sugar-binding periplasmic protein precursor [Microbacterium azadirachtae]